MPKPTAEELSHRVNYHPPTERAAAMHTTARELTLNLMEEFNQLLPEGREHSLAQTKLEEALFWANAAIARNHANIG